jgi:hypothetical protein
MFGTNQRYRRGPVRSAICRSSGRADDGGFVGGWRVGDIGANRAGPGSTATSMELVEQRRAEEIPLVRGDAIVIEPCSGPRRLARVAQDGA